MDSTIQNLESYFVNGFYKGHVDFLEQVDFDKYYFVNHDDPERILDKNIEPLLYETRDYILENYIKKVFPDFIVTQSTAWSGVDEYSSRWHNDSTEGFDSNILVYLDDSYNSNKLEVKNNSEEFTIYHKKGDFVWINQSPNFLHKATHITGKRRVFSFELKWIL